MNVSDAEAARTAKRTMDTATQVLHSQPSDEPQTVAAHSSRNVTRAAEHAADKVSLKFDAGAGHATTAIDAIMKRLWILATRARSVSQRHPRILIGVTCALVLTLSAMAVIRRRR